MLRNQDLGARYACGVPAPRPSQWTELRTVWMYIPVDIIYVCIMCFSVGILSLNKKAKIHVQ